MCINKYIITCHTHCNIIDIILVLAKEKLFLKYGIVLYNI